MIPGTVELTLSLLFGQRDYEGFPGNKNMSEVDISHCNEYFKALLNAFLI